MSRNVCSAEQRQDILSKLPQKPPFLFLDQILELSPEHIVAEYRFKKDESFYAGHFPGDPVTPGVILVEAMAQAGLVAMGIYLLELERPGVSLRTMFTDCAVDFSHAVLPEQKVIITGERLFWRRNKIQSKVELRLENGVIAAHGVVSGMGILL
jgi:3-hydroxyacyl-[acyl-carrier-protein] dehydratase